MTRLAADHVAELNWQVKSLGGPEGEREHRFHPERKWRLDLAFPAHRVAVEVDGGSWVQGRHTGGVGFYNDCEKLSVAAAFGWRVLRVTPMQIQEGKAAGWLLTALAFEARGGRPSVEPPRLVPPPHTGGSDGT